MNQILFPKQGKHPNNMKKTSFCNYNLTPHSCTSKQHGFFFFLISCQHWNLSQQSNKFRVSSATLLQTRYHNINSLFELCGATGVTSQLHQILRLPRKMNLMIDPRLTWNVIYKARSNRNHPPTAPNTAPATQKWQIDRWKDSWMDGGWTDTQRSKFVEIPCGVMCNCEAAVLFLSSKWRPWDRDPGALHVYKALCILHWPWCNMSYLATQKVDTSHEFLYCFVERIVGIWAI